MSNPAQVCARRSLDEEEAYEIAIGGNLVMQSSGLESHPAKVGHQPEASLAWCEGDLGCEA